MLKKIVKSWKGDGSFANWWRTLYTCIGLCHFFYTSRLPFSPFPPSLDTHHAWNTASTGSWEIVSVHLTRSPSVSRIVLTHSWSLNWTWVSHQVSIHYIRHGNWWFVIPNLSRRQSSHWMNKPTAYLPFPLHCQVKCETRTCSANLSYFITTLAYADLF